MRCMRACTTSSHITTRTLSLLLLHETQIAWTHVTHIYDVCDMHICIWHPPWLYYTYTIHTFLLYLYTPICYLYGQRHFYAGDERPGADTPAAALLGVSLSSWPLLHDIVIANMVWCKAYTREVKGGSYICSVVVQ